MDDSFLLNRPGYLFICLLYLSNPSQAIEAKPGPGLVFSPLTLQTSSSFLWTSTHLCSCDPSTCSRSTYRSPRRVTPPAAPSGRPGHELGAGSGAASGSRAPPGDGGGGSLPAAAERGVEAEVEVEVAWSDHGSKEAEVGGGEVGGDAGVAASGEAGEESTSDATSDGGAEGVGVEEAEEALSASDGVRTSGPGDDLTCRSCVLSRLACLRAALVSRSAVETSMAPLGVMDAEEGAVAGGEADGGSEEGTTSPEEEARDTSSMAQHC